MKISGKSLINMKKPASVIESIIRIAIISASLLLIPVALMLFADGMDWSLFDFVIVWLLLFGSGTAYKLMTMKMNNINYRIGVALAVLSGLLMVWINLAVGIVGSGPNIPNLLYSIIPTIGILGAISVRFEPKGMAWILFAMAIINVVLAVTAVIFDISMEGEDSTVQIIMFNFFFIVLWIASALLFRNAALDESR